MEYSPQQTNHEPRSTLDGPVAQPVFTDPEVQNLYQYGFIGRPLAEVFNIIADFNDNGDQGRAVCSRS